MAIDINTTHVGGGSCSGGNRKRQHELPADVMENARNVFVTMPVADDEANPLFMENIIFKGGGGGIPYDPDETQSQDG
ncbi:DNA repair protein rhp54 [Hordeum vulgare]|nr:DNA repair protein rhp54 [Hordeum vulgare]